MIFDPLYMLIGGVGLLLSLAATGWVKMSFRKWSKVPLRRGMTGKDVAAAILRAEGITGVAIEETRGFLGDHYDPRTRTLRLSSDNFRGSSVAASSTWPCS